MRNVPLGRNFLTLTTTRTLPPGTGLETPSRQPAGTITLSLDLRDGLEAEDLKVAADALEVTLVAPVCPLSTVDPVLETEECEPGPYP